ncbi:hypothetical protein B7Z28_01375, partial [Candidatus Saccharibacteria bacterium 32-45-3]
MHQDFFNTNRNNFMEAISGGVAVIASYTAMQRAGDAAQPFEQEANFWYLTGIESPDWWLIIDGSRHKSWLVAPEVSDMHQVFEGSLTAEQAKQTSGVEDVLNNSEAFDMLRDLARKHSVAYTLGDPVGLEHFNFHMNPTAKSMWQRLERTFTRVQDCRQELSVLRAIKQPEEIAAIKKVIDLTIGAFTDIKQRLDEFNYEYEIEAEFGYYFRRKGAKGHDYDPIVAFGKNACTLHYSENDSRLRKGNLLLLDVGARHHGYAADITRTYAYGTPTKYQQEVHTAVDTAHHEIVKLI